MKLIEMKNIPHYVLIRCLDCGSPNDLTYLGNGHFACKCGCQMQDEKEEVSVAS